MKMDTMKELLDKFAEIDANRDGLVDINEFAKYLSLPVTSHVKHLFTLYDRVSLQWTFKRWYDIRLLTRNGGCYFSCVRPQVRYACVYISVGNWVLVFFAFGYVCVQRSVFARGSAFLLVPLHEGKECRARAWCRRTGVHFLLCFMLVSF